MNFPSNIRFRRGFTLMETVIAIGVLAVLLTAFLAVFGPAASGIRRAINVQEADRLASTLERELVTLREGQATGGNIQTGFDKAYEWIEQSHEPTEAIFVYQYRGNADSVRTDGTLQPRPTRDGVPGKDYIVQTMVRRLSDQELFEDLNALEGSVFVVKATQLIFENGELVPGQPGQIVDPKGGSGGGTAQQYPEAVIAFSAAFYGLPANNATYLQGQAFRDRFPQLQNPVFTRNLAVRR